MLHMAGSCPPSQLALPLHPLLQHHQREIQSRPQLQVRTLRLYGLMLEQQQSKSLHDCFTLLLQLARALGQQAEEMLLCRSSAGQKVSGSGALAESIHRCCSHNATCNCSGQSTFCVCALMHVNMHASTTSAWLEASACISCPPLRSVSHRSVSSRLCKG